MKAPPGKNDRECHKKKKEKPRQKCHKIQFVEEWELLKYPVKMWHINYYSSLLMQCSVNIHQTKHCQTKRETLPRSLAENSVKCVKIRQIMKTGMTHCITQIFTHLYTPLHTLHTHLFFFAAQTRLN